MKINETTKFLIIGLGVMGGSYAMALSRQGYSVSCITLNQEDIDYAVSRNMIVYGSTEVEPELVASADIVVFAVYPHTFLEWVKTYQHYFRRGTLITDVTGVKGCVVNQIQEILRPDVEFIAAHPMAGRERSGVSYSDDGVFRGANYIVTPTEKNTHEAIDTCKELGQILGFARVSELTVSRHDEMVAFLSQLTHCIAVTLMTCNSSEDMEKYTGDSFRDLTRIAKINDVMWSELFMLNKQELLRQMDSFISEFEKFKNYLSGDDRAGMQQMMRASSTKRLLFDKKI